MKATTTMNRRRFLKAVTHLSKMLKAGWKAAMPG